MVIEYKKDCFLDTEMIIGIDSDQQFVILQGATMKVEADIFDRIKDAYIHLRKSTMYDYTDKESETYQKKRPVVKKGE